MHRIDVINHLIGAHGYRRYLEIGVAGGWCFDGVECEHKDGVDPQFPATFAMTSDEFFALEHEPYDIVFVDGLHTADQAYRDIRNALGILADGGTILAHDCLPDTLEEGSDTIRYDGPWYGGVWHAIARLRTDPALSVKTIATDCGIAVIRPGKQKPYPLPDPLTFEHYLEDRKRMLRVITPAEFLRGR
jgi:predicted O-methyltransferase YrrM